ncbi:transferase hexapeptide (six repeat-containing protein) [Rheinheimera pacifica]|uniref:Transferase hexapeptide (Six repeat-containing protein) n=1 Tax=Rheinheimera pacifica TaxID=173990 RepID=A0A1H6MMM9_9GAMM|nr:acetyltransferase [Rheinheimera pacifica]PKM19393.1 MAG: acetyltransferase [Gammaproteobacteria bacterium HGW-Gammaproteobacteria-15]SEH98909.1 transferase hexapeptide (six repeat-containing protein) [Rheinheimera pacifica]
MKTLAIIGASGHGKVVADAARSCCLWKDIVFYDDAWPAKTRNGNSDIVGNTQSLLDLDDRPDIIVAIGNNKVRLAKQQQLIAVGFTAATVVHPRAVVSVAAVIGSGSVVMAGAVVNADAVVGVASIVNSNAVVEHDCVLGDAVHISPGACLAGGVIVGEFSWIGIGASAIQLKRIGKNVKVGAGAAVVNDLPDGVTAVGVPAKIIKS